MLSDRAECTRTDLKKCIAINIKNYNFSLDSDILVRAILQMHLCVVPD